MDKEAICCTTQIIDGEGVFKAYELDNFLKQIKLGECGLSYAVVAIIGPQSSGKSTLLNHLFQTNFDTMNAEIKRERITEGILIARCDGIKPCTIVMDLEGTDGEVRGKQGDTAFEKKCALFAIAVSQIVIINMWCHDIGREQAANKPLLETVLQVMLKLFSPRKTTLMFVIRDKTRTPHKTLKLQLKESMHKIWDSLPKPEAHKDTPLSKFFNVKVVSLSSYEYQEEQFKKDVSILKRRFLKYIAPGGLAGDREGVVPASGFSVSAQDIWKDIKDNKYLDLTSHKIMVATVLCEKISTEKYESFKTNKDWLELKEDVESHLVPRFGMKLSFLLDNCLSNYDKEAMYYDGDVKSAKRKQLEEKLTQLVEPACKYQFGHIRSEAQAKFESALNEGQQFALAARDCTNKSMSEFNELCKEVTSKLANWDATKIRDEFSHDLNSHITKVRAAKIYELTAIYESNFKEALCTRVEALLEVGSDDTWPAIRMHLHVETDTVVSRFSSALSGFEVDEQEKEDIISKLKNYARKLIEGKAKTEAGKVLGRMKERFTFTFNHHNDSKPRIWTVNEDITAITKTAWTSCLKLLSVLAVIRLDENKTDTIWETLVDSLLEDTTISHVPLASSTWVTVPAPDTLITPVQCKSLWDQFQRETKHIINYARATQEAEKRRNDKLEELATFSNNLGKGFGIGLGLALANRVRFPPT